MKTTARPKKTAARAPAARPSRVKAAARPAVKRAAPAPAKKPVVKHTAARKPVAAVAAPRRPAASRPAPARVVVKKPARRPVAAVAAPVRHVVKKPAPRPVAPVAAPARPVAKAPAPRAANGSAPNGSATALRAPAGRAVERSAPPRQMGRPGSSRMGALKQVKPLVAAEKTGCTHHWVIEPPNGAVSAGKCRMCGEKREFRNSYEYSSWYGTKTPPKPVAGAPAAAPAR